MGKLKRTSQEKYHSTPLKVISIIMILTGILLALGTVFAMTFVKVIDSNIVSYQDLQEVGINQGETITYLMVKIAIMGIQAVVQLVAGIVGLRVARGKGQILTCEVFSIVVLGVAILSFVIEGFILGFSLSSPIDFVIPLVVPTLYALLARREAKQPYWQSIEAAKRTRIGKVETKSHERPLLAEIAPTPIALPLSFALAANKVSLVPLPEEDATPSSPGITDAAEEEPPAIATIAPLADSEAPGGDHSSSTSWMVGLNQNSYDR